MFQLIKFIAGASFCLFLLSACGETSGESTGDSGEATTASTNQGYKKVIEERLYTYIDHTNKSNWDAMLDMVYPKVFQAISRAEMISTFQQMEAQGMTILTENPKMLNCSEIETVEGEDFVFVDYSADLTVKLSGEQFQDPNIQEMFRAQLEQAYGPGTVSINESGDEMYVKAEKMLFAISDNAKNDWKFLENNGPDLTMLEGYLPAQIIDKYKVKEE